MNKLIISTLILLALLISAEHLLDASRETHRVVTQTVRSIPGNENQKSDAIRSFSISFSDTTWAYQWIDGNWHYPAYENAFGLNDRIQRFIEGVVESQGTVVAFDRTQAQHYGFSLPTTLTLSLTDSTGNWTQNLQIGRSLPSRDANEAYMALTNSDTLFHMHADPRRLLAWEREPQLPPLIDPKMMPSALMRRAIKKIQFTTGPITEIERIEIEPEEDENARPHDGPTYEWYASINGKRKQVVNGSIYSFISYINRIKYSKLHPRNNANRFGPSALILTDDQDTADTLEIGTQTSDGQTLIRHRTTGQILGITQAKAELLFPNETRLDTLSRPSVYDRAEPTGPFSLATP